MKARATGRQQLVSPQQPAFCPPATVAAVTAVPASGACPA